MRELLSYYIALEEYYMEESVTKVPHPRTLATCSFTTRRRVSRAKQGSRTPLCPPTVHAML